MNVDADRQMIGMKGGRGVDTDDLVAEGKRRVGG
jgi:hypothetical protein